MTDQEKIIDALDKYFNREEPPKFINTSRIPLICQDINKIHTDISWLKLANMGLYALVGAGIIAILTAILH